MSVKYYSEPLIYDSSFIFNLLLLLIKVKCQLQLGVCPCTFDTDPKNQDNNQLAAGQGLLSGPRG